MSYRLSWVEGLFLFNLATAKYCLLIDQGLLSAVDFWKINTQSVFCFLTFHTAELNGQNETHKNSV
jgi:hypothetical protein